MATRIRRAPNERAERSAAVTPRGGTVATAIVVPVVGAHGGCGASTLAHFLGAGVEEAVADQAGHLVGIGFGARGVFDGIGPTPLGQLRGCPVVVVGRGTAQGATRAGNTAGFLSDHGLLVVVAIVGDGLLRDPVAVRARVRSMRGWTTAVVRVPYVARWRFIDQPDGPPVDYMAAVEEVRAAIRQHVTG